MNIADIFKWQSLPHGNREVMFVGEGVDEAGPPITAVVTQRKLMGRIVLTFEAWLDSYRFTPHGQQLAFVLRRRLGLTEKQITRVFRKMLLNRRRHSRGAFVRAAIEEIQATTRDIAAMTERMRDARMVMPPWWRRRPRYWIYRLQSAWWRWTRG